MYQHLIRWNYCHLHKNFSNREIFNMEYLLNFSSKESFCFNMQQFYIQLDSFAIGWPPILTNIFCSHCKVTLHYEWRIKYKLTSYKKSGRYFYTFSESESAYSFRGYMFFKHQNLEYFMRNLVHFRFKSQNLL